MVETLGFTMGIPWGFRAGILIRNDPGSQSLRIRREWMYSWLEKYGHPMIQWKFQDPKMEVRSYHISGYILGLYPLKFSPQKSLMMIHFCFEWDYY